MNLRLKTSYDVESKLAELQSGLQFSTKAAAMKLAIGYSCQLEGDPRTINGIETNYDIKNQNGADYQRFTILGSDEIIYKIIFEQQLGMPIDDNTFFPELVNAHIERGIKLLYSDFKYANNKDKFLKNLLLRRKEVIT